MKRNNIYRWFLLVLLIAASCASEDERLLNPTPRSETVRIRFFNLAGDKADRTLLVGDSTKFINVKYGEISELVKPTGDSANIEVRKGDVKENRSAFKFQFSRNTTYTFIAIPGKKGAVNSKAVDTVVAFSTSVAVSGDGYESYVKIFNANPDTSRSYTVNLGCPGGTVLFNSIGFRGSAALYPLRPGANVLSLIRNTSTGPELIGLYEISLENLKQYTLIIRDDGSGGESLLFLDDKESTKAALSAPKKLSERIAKVRTINLSTDPVDVKKAPGDPIVNGVVPNVVSSYQSVGACGSFSKDTIVAYSSSVAKSKAFVSLNVNEKYTTIVFDSADAKAARTMVVEPAVLNSPLNDSALIRVVNADYTLASTTVSLGARYDSKADKVGLERGFVSGDNLAVNLKFGYYSGYKKVTPGLLPFAVFNDFPFSSYVKCSKFKVEAGKSYLLILSNKNGVQEMFLVEDGFENNGLTALKEGIFLQYVNATVESNPATVSFGELFSQAKVYYAGALATIADEGSNTISVNGVSYTFNCEKSKRALIISTGDNNNTEIIDFQTPFMGADQVTFKRRFINASKENNYIDVKSNDSTIVFPNLAYKAVSTIESFDREKRYFLIFDNAETKTSLVQITDIYPTFNKNYTIIFAGAKSVGYTAIIQQEY